MTQERTSNDPHDVGRGNRKSKNRQICQGQSAASFMKERRFGSALAIGMNVFAQKLNTHIYWHADTNAGCGVNHDVLDSLTGNPLEGSPLIAMRAASTAGILRFRPFMCDIDPAAVSELSKRTNGSAVIFNGDNNEFLGVFAKIVSESDRAEYATGSVLVDPNGWFYRNKKGMGAPTGSISMIADMFPRIDIVMNLNVRTYQLMRGNVRNSARDYDGNLIGVYEVMQSLKKSNWLISEIETCGKDKFVVIVGRNVKTGDHRSIGFHHASSEVGKMIISEIEMENKFYVERQHRLF